MFRFRNQLLISRLCRLTKASSIKLLGLAVVVGLVVATMMGSFAGAPSRVAYQAPQAGYAGHAHVFSVSSKTRSRGHAQPRPVAPTTASKLRMAFAAFYNLPVRDVGVATPGSLHVAEVPAQNSFLATAEFPPSGRIPTRVAMHFQDGGDIGIFRSANDSFWRMTGAGGEPFPCPSRLPSGTLDAWGLAPSPLCAPPAATHPRHHPAPSPPRLPSIAAPNAAAGSIAQVAERQVGVGDTPVSRSFAAPDCDPYTALVGEYPGSARCGISPRFGVRDQNEFWCADFAKWVWRRAGVRSDLRTLDPGAASFYTWAREHGQRPRFGSDSPAVGDAVVFYPPSEHAPEGTWADHVGIVVGVHSNGTVNLVNGDFGGGGVPITVEQNNDISLASWASEVWNSGEKWIFVSPGAVNPPRPKPQPKPKPPPPLPAISSFTAAPSSLPGAGGLVTLAASASHATSYSFTASAPGPVGLQRLRSRSGRASDTVTLPLNSTGQPVRYTFTVTATGPGGRTSSAVSVTVSSLVSGGYVTPRYGTSDQTDAFGVTAAGAVTVTSAAGHGAWTTARVTGRGFAPSGAAVATSPRYGVPGQTDAFVTGRNGAVDLLWADGGRTWHSTSISAARLAPAGAAIAASPQYGVSGQTDAFVTGRNGAVDLLWADGGRTWHSTSISARGLAPPGAAIATSAQYGAPGQTDVYVVGRNGAVDLLWAEGGGTWHSTSISAPGLAPAGAAIATSPQYGVADQTDAFVAGANGAIDLLSATDGGSWRTTPISPRRLAPPGAAIATSPQYGVADQTDAFVAGANGAIDLLTASYDGTWRDAPVSAPRSAPAGAAIATSPAGGPDQTAAFVRDNHGRVSLYWATVGSSWHSKRI